MPLVGYSYHEQNLHLKDGAVVAPVYNEIDGLDSSYDTEWSGPWLGTKATYTPSERWQFSVDLEYHWADYYAEADWNLRDDFQHPKSFVHKADGKGFVGKVGVSCQLTQRWSVGFNAVYSDWKTDDGIDKLYLVDGAVLKSRLNEVNWTSVSGHIMIESLF